MIAVIEIGGHQAIVQVGDVLEIDRKDAEINATVEFPVLLQSQPDGSDCQIGTPIIEGVMVQAKVIGHDKADKIKVFKMKPRKRYRRTMGFRAERTTVEIISLGGAKSAPKAKAAPKKASAKSTNKGDDLTKIEGIGPKIASVLTEQGIASYTDLSKAKVNKLESILEAAKLSQHQPTTWPQQAQLAADGQWDELKALQDKLNGGKA